MHQARREHKDLEERRGRRVQQVMKAQRVTLVKLGLQVQLAKQVQRDQGGTQVRRVRGVRLVPLAHVARQDGLVLKDRRESKGLPALVSRARRGSRANQGGRAHVASQASRASRASLDLSRKFRKQSRTRILLC